jgi:pilus assembly protein Flp/PilA
MCFKSFLADELGATLVEYGVALILAIVVGGTGLIVIAGEVNENMTAGSEVVAFVDQ